MGPRTILYTGKGGVGKTSVAACTARACARAGLRTLVISTDPAHSLSESFEAELASEPVEIEARLWGQEVKAQEEMERHWSGVRDWLGELFVERGVDRISADELTVPPGMDELFSLLRLQGHHRSGDWDAIIVDCAPTGETLRLLSFPDVARWWIEKVFPDGAPDPRRGATDRALAARHPVAQRSGVRRHPPPLREPDRDERDPPRPGAIDGPAGHEPRKMVIGEAMRTFTYLNLYGYLTDAVIVNRIFPAEVGDYFAGWRRVQEEHLELVESAFSPVPVLRAPYFDREVIGAEMLDRLAAELFTDRAAEDVLHDTVTQELEIPDVGARLRLALPFARKGDIALKKIGLELVVRVDGQKRTITLPPALAAFRPTEATFEDGALEIRFDDAPRPSPSKAARRRRA